MKSSTRARVRRAVGVVGLAAATLLAFGGFAQAEPEAAAVISACVDKKTGDVRIPDLPRGGGHGCGKNEQSVVWNIKGPRGPQGKPGRQGPPGPPTLPAAFETANLRGTLTPNTDPRDIALLEGLPAGRYQFTSTITAETVGGNPFFRCSLEKNGNVAEQFATMLERIAGQPDPSQGYGVSSSMTALVTVAAGDRVAARCFGVGSYVTKLVAVAVAPAPAP
ncbi:hypothetical protein QEZ54_16335 [Catellatospora sp. KI3]|uniref:hypothetical protein n=1 Tax=Catellatospora sp. KI3 TaxID=3041620 RepID=UPI002482B6B4|nr:hypothetical protein [Catellatospora sp. KI3]MDI1462541.1 hypothetical protein [Catellatospora sp. KI3]